MSNGTSRVDAEAAVFKRDDADNPNRDVDPEKRCSVGDQSESYRLTYQQRTEAESKHAECIASIKRAANQGRDYLSCVQRYKDSNAIEENCKFN